MGLLRSKGEKGCAERGHGFQRARAVNAGRQHRRTDVMDITVEQGLHALSRGCRAHNILEDGTAVIIRPVSYFRKQR